MDILGAQNLLGNNPNLWNFNETPPVTNLNNLCALFVVVEALFGALPL